MNNTGTQDAGFTWSPGRPLVLKNKLATSFIWGFCVCFKLWSSPLSLSLKKAIVYPNRFMPSPVSLAPLINNVQGPCVKNNYSFLFSLPTHATPGNLQLPKTARVLPPWNVNLNKQIFLSSCVSPFTTNHFFPATCRCHASLFNQKDSSTPPHHPLFWPDKLTC